MYTNLATSPATSPAIRTTIRSTALAACLALLFAGATACGTEDGAAAPPAAAPGPAREYYHGQYHQQNQDRGFPFDAIEKAKAHAARASRRYPHRSKPSSYGVDRGRPTARAPGTGAGRTHRRAWATRSPANGEIVTPARGPAPQPGPPRDVVPRSTPWFAATDLVTPPRESPR
jgi:hypothetical protein